MDVQGGFWFRAHRHGIRSGAVPWLPAKARHEVQAAVTQESTFPQVDRRSGLSVREFRHEYLYPGRPVVITDAIEGWRSNSVWSFDGLGSLCGDASVLLHRYDRETEFTPENVEHMRFGRFLDAIATEDWGSFPYYLRDNWQLFRMYEKLMDEHAVPEFFFDWFRLLPAFMRMPYPRIFIGPKGAVTPLHSDVRDTHAWLSQLVGRKRWLMFSPDQRDLLYEYQVRVELPDLDRFPLYVKARPRECIIGPGDTIFVPTRWAHWVESLDAAISLTYNYMGPGCFWPCLRYTAADVIARASRRLRGAVVAKA